MMLAGGYFDESTDGGSNQQCITIAGFVGGQEPALILDLRWRDLLKQYKMPYFKASQLEMGFGCFAHLRDDPTDLSKPLSKREKELIVEIKTAFVNLIVEADELYGIGTVLMLADLERLHLEKPAIAHKLPLPYYLCAQLTLVEAGQMTLLSNQQVKAAGHVELQGNLRPIFDSHEEYSPGFKQAFASFAAKNPISSKYLLPPHYEREQDYVVLQAADCLAYEARRMLIRQEYEQHRKERLAMTRMKENRVWRIYKLNYEALEIIAEHQKPDNIPIEPELENRLYLEF